MQVLWPGFLGAATTSGILFSLVDPLEIALVADRFGGSREAGYTTGFLILRALSSASCAMSWTLAGGTERRLR